MFNSTVKKNALVVVILINFYIFIPLTYTNNSLPNLAHALNENLLDTLNKEIENLKQENKKLKKLVKEVTTLKNKLSSPPYNPAHEDCYKWLKKTVENLGK